jgi:NADPH:quinone reductase-like Zn-dependent oxidoreductase
VEIAKEATDTTFKVGDRVAARFVVGPRDALAEYAHIHQGVCKKVPNNILSVDAAALAGACPATLLVKRI